MSSLVGIRPTWGLLAQAAVIGVLVAFDDLRLQGLSRVDQLMCEPYGLPATGAASCPSSVTDTVAGVAGCGLAEPPSAARTGDLVGLAAFLDWMHTGGDGFGLAPRTVANIRSVWRSARRRLNLPA